MCILEKLNFKISLREGGTLPPPPPPLVYSLFRPMILLLVYSLFRPAILLLPNQLWSASAGPDTCKSSVSFQGTKLFNWLQTMILLTLKLAGYFDKHIQAKGGGVRWAPPKNFETANN